MKIAFLNIYNGVVERGSEVFVKEMATKLTQKHKVSVYQIGKEEKAEYEVKQVKGISYILSQGFLYNFWVLVFTLKCLSSLWQEKFDWIIPINGRFQVILCRILRFFRGGKILICGHAGIGFDDKFNILIGRPDIFVALTPTAFSWAKKYYSRIKYIPNGVDLTAFNPKVKSADISLKKPVVFCNSALLPYKRLNLVIKAVAQLPAVSLLIIGDGPLKKEITFLGQQLLGNRFRLLPAVPYKEIASYYTAANVFTLPSRESEAFGLVYIEALASNIPVVAPDDANRREIIGNGGLYCNVEDISSYAQALLKAINTDFGDKPRKQAEKYSWDIIIRQYEKILAES